MLKEKILSQVSEVEIFEKYIGQKIQLGRAIISPLREEKHASFNVYQNEQGKFLFKDFSGERGDCFSFVMKLYGCSFSESLKIIANDFNIEKNKSWTMKPKTKIPSIIKKERKTLYVQKCEWNPETLKFWNDLNVKEAHLKHYNIYPLHSYTMRSQSGDFFTINSSHDNPIFCYDHQNGAYKIYRPFEKNKKYKFVSNLIPGDIYGLNLFDHAKLCIITAGEKDSISLFANTGIPGIALNSESASLTKAQYIKIMSKVDNLMVCYDSDSVGQKYAWKISSQYDIPAISIDQWMDFDGKDISDMASSEKGREILRKMIQYEGEYQIRKNSNNLQSR